MLTKKDLANLFNSFQSYLLQSGASKATSKNYSSDIRTLIENLPENTLITSKVLADLVASLGNRFSESTLRRFHFSLKYFVSWLNSQGYRFEAQINPVKSGKNISNPIDNYVSEIENQGAADRTVNNYRNDLNSFFSWSNTPPSSLNEQAVKKVSHLDIKRYINYLKSKNFSDSSIKRYLFSLRSFFQIQKKPIVLDNNPVRPSFIPSSGQTKPFWKKVFNYRPSWWHSYRGHQMSDWVNWAASAGTVLLVGLMIWQGLFSPKPIDITNLKTEIQEGLVLAATPPRVLSFQGRLADENGIPVTTNKTIVFKIYDAETLGTLLWTSKNWSVTPDSNGIFSVCLGGQDTGDDCLLNGIADTVIGDAIFRDNAATYLDITVAGQTLTPRQRIASSPYALNSDNLDGIDSTAFLRSDTSDNFTSGTLTTNATTTFDVNGNIALGGATFSEDFNLDNVLLTDIGAAGTDFTTGGGLTLALDLTVTGNDINFGNGEILDNNTNSTFTFSTNAAGTPDKIALLPNTAGGATFTATISTADLTVGNQTFNLPDLAAATSATVCVSGQTCASSGTVGYWSRSGTTLSPSTSGDAITTSGNISTSGSGTITSAGLLTGSNGFTLTTGALNLTATSGSIAATGFGTTSITSTTTSGSIFALTNTSLTAASANLANLTFKNNNTGAGVNVNGLSISDQAPATPSSGTNTTKLINATLTSTSGTGIDVSSTASLTTAKLFNVDHTATYSSTVTNSGNLLNLNRALTSSAVITRDNDFEAQGEGSNTLTWSHTLGSGANRILMVGVSIQNDGAQTISSVTYNGVSMTDLNNDSNQGTIRTEIFYMRESSLPAAGTYDITVTTSASTKIFAGSLSFFNVHQTSTFNTNPTPTTGTGSGSDFGESTMTITSAVGEMAFYVEGHYLTGADVNSLDLGMYVSNPNGETNRWSGGTLSTGSFYTRSQGMTKDGASPNVTVGGRTFDIDAGETGYYAHTGVSIKPASLVVTGAVANISSNCTLSGNGLCSDSATVLSLTQSYATSTGSVLNILNSGSGSGINLLAGIAPAADMVSITNSGFASTTSGIDGLQITFGSSNASGNIIDLTPSFAGGATDALTYNVIDIDAFSPTNASGTDTVNGLNFGNLTDPGATINSSALRVGTGWDREIFFADTTPTIEIANDASARTLSITNPGAGTADLDVEGHGAFGSGASISTIQVLNLNETRALTVGSPTFQGFDLTSTTTTPTGFGDTGSFINYGGKILASAAGGDDNATLNDSVYGLYVESKLTGLVLFNEVVAVDAFANNTSGGGSGVLSTIAFRGAATDVNGSGTLASIFYAKNSTIQAGSTINGLYIEPFTSGGARYGIYQAGNTGTNSNYNILAANTRIGDTSNPTATLDIVSTSASATVVKITDTSLTTGIGLDIAPGSGITSGAAIKVAASGTSAIANGLVQISHSGAYTSTGGLLNVTSSASTAGSLVSFTNNTAAFTGTAQTINVNGLTSGTGLLVNSAPTLTSTTTVSGKLLDINRAITVNASGSSQPTYLSSAQNQIASATGSAYNIPFTVSSNSNRMLTAVFQVKYQSTMGATIQYAGQNMTCASSVFYMTVVMCYIANPTSGNNNVTFTPSAAANVTYVFTEYNNVDTTVAPTTQFYSSSGTQALTTGTQSISSTASDIVQDGSAAMNCLTTASTSSGMGGGQTGIENQRINASSCYDLLGMSSYKAGSAGSTTMSQSWSISSYWQYGLMAIRGLSPGATLSQSLASISSNCSVTAGSCTDSSNILSLNQQYASATGGVLSITNAGSGAGICFDCDGTYSPTTVSGGIKWGTDATSTQNLRLYRSNGAAAAQITIDDGAGTVLVQSNTTTTSINLSAQVGGTAQRLCHNGVDAAAGVQAIGDCGATQADLAEFYDDLDNSEPGELVSSAGAYQVDTPSGTTTVASVKKTTKAYDRNLIGVISTNPSGEILGEASLQYMLHPKPIALSGRVPTKVSTENGDIKPGDPLTSSSTPGVAMKATKAGYVIGRALSAFTSTDPTEIGTVVVFINTHYANPINLEDFDLNSSASNLLTLNAENNLVATVSAGTKFVWQNTAGQVVAWVSDAGEAFFQKVTALAGDFGKLVFGEAVVKKEAKSAGEASFIAGATEVTIESDKVREDSLINLTPTTKTAGLSLYVKEKRPGEGFIVALERNSGDSPNQATASATTAIRFTWFILNQE